MREIRVVTLDKARPALVLTREYAIPVLSRVTVAPITSTIRGTRSELPVGPANGLDHDCAVYLDGMLLSVPSDRLGRVVGYLLPDQEARLHASIVAAFDLAAD